MENNINALNRHGETVLILAAPKGNIDEVRKLLEAGADPCIQDRHGMTARMRAQNRGHHEIVALLEKAEEKAGCSDRAGQELKHGDEDGAVYKSAGQSQAFGGHVAASTTFSIYRHPTYGYEAIKNGFSWPGFFFTWIWALVKKLWVQGIMLFFVVSAFSSVGYALLEGNTLGVVFGLILINLPGVVTGFLGNTWRENSMPSRGYELIKRVEASTADGAIAMLDKDFRSNDGAVDNKLKEEKTNVSNEPAQISDTKECPMCAETIKAKALICRYCGYKFES